MPGTRSKSPAKAQVKKAATLRDEGDLFAGDRAAMLAVQAAMKQGDFAVVAEALALLGEIRAANRERALASNELIVFDQWPDGASAAMASPEDSTPPTGSNSGKKKRRGNEDDIDIGWRPAAAAYLFKPPLVGADGRALRDLADRLGVPVFVVVREPTTRMNLWPVVMIGPAVVRVRVPPPADDEPTIDWLLLAQEQLAAEAIRECETEDRLEIRLELLLERIITLHYEESLFAAAIDTAKSHTRALKREARQAAKPKASASRSATEADALDVEEDED